MKRLFLIGFILFASSLFAQGNHDPQIILPTAGASTVNTQTFWITGTESDTSTVKQIWEFCGNDFFGFDSTGDDSMNLTISLQTCTNTSDAFENLFSSWATVESWTISTDSLVVKNDITDNIIPIDMNYRYIVKGNTGNSISTPSGFRGKHKNYSQARHTAGIDYN